MFYSQTFLARKGPLGTVWCAAHLQHKLKKSHYAATNIPTTVERIMYPEVPMALRMSSHLLLGVVRIYAKQVEYFFQDCNVLLVGLRKAYSSPDVNLPENATHATLESVTLPDNFQLDALDLYVDFHIDRFHDNHLRSQEEITLEDQIPAEQDPYIVITLSEDDVRNSCMGDISGSGQKLMEEDSHPYNHVDATTGSEDPDPSNEARINNDRSPQNFPEIEVMREAPSPEIKVMRDSPIPEIEVMRDASVDYLPEDVPFWPDQREDRMEPDTVLMEIMKEKETHIPAMESLSGDLSFPPEQLQEPVSAVSELGPEIFNSRDGFAQLATPELAIRSTPPAEQPMRRPKRRKQHYDEVTILSNRYMKQRLDESIDTLRRRKNCPCAALDIWKANKRFKKDAIFVEPLMTGLSVGLSDIYNKGFISSKPHLAVTEEACPTVPESSASVHELDMEIERLRNCETPAANNFFPELVRSPKIVSPTRLVPSPNGRDDYTPTYGTEMSYRSDHIETTIGTASDLAASTGPIGSDMETPVTFSEEHLGVQNTCLSDIPELASSADGDLSFLAEDDYTPAGSQGTPDYFLRKQSGISEVDTLSVRTRAVAQFIKNKSSVTPNIKSQFEELSLNKILDGKRKKLCARMVFETLVLKNCGLVDVQQEEPFGDITLKVTPKLSKEQFSS